MSILISNFLVSHLDSKILQQCNKPLKPNFNLEKIKVDLVTTMKEKI